MTFSPQASWPGFQCQVLSLRSFSQVSSLTKWEPVRQIAAHLAPPRGGHRMANATRVPWLDLQRPVVVAQVIDRSDHDWDTRQITALVAAGEAISLFAQGIRGRVFSVQLLCSVQTGLIVVPPSRSINSSTCSPPRGAIP